MKLYDCSNKTCLASASSVSSSVRSTLGPITPQPYHHRQKLHSIGGSSTESVRPRALNTANRHPQNGGTKPNRTRPQRLTQPQQYYHHHHHQMDHDDQVFESGQVQSPLQPQPQAVSADTVDKIYSLKSSIIAINGLSSHHHHHRHNHIHNHNHQQEKPAGKSAAPNTATATTTNTTNTGADDCFGTGAAVIDKTEHYDHRHHHQHEHHHHHHQQTQHHQCYHGDQQHTSGGSSRSGSSTDITDDSCLSSSSTSSALSSPSSPPPPPTTTTEAKPVEVSQNKHHHHRRRHHHNHQQCSVAASSVELSSSTTTAVCAKSSVVVASCGVGLCCAQDGRAIAQAICCCPTSPALSSSSSLLSDSCSSSSSSSVSCKSSPSDRSLLSCDHNTCSCFCSSSDSLDSSPVSSSLCSPSSCSPPPSQVNSLDDHCDPLQDQNAKNYPPLQSSYSDSVVAVQCKGSSVWSSSNECGSLVSGSSASVSKMTFAETLRYLPTALAPPPHQSVVEMVAANSDSESGGSDGGDGGDGSVAPPPPTRPNRGQSGQHLSDGHDYVESAMFDPHECHHRNLDPTHPHHHHHHRNVSCVSSFVRTGSVSSSTTTTSTDSSASPLSNSSSPVPTVEDEDEEVKCDQSHQDIVPSDATFYSSRPNLVNGGDCMPMVASGPLPLHFDHHHHPQPNPSYYYSNLYNSTTAQPSSLTYRELLHKQWLDGHLTDLILKTYTNRRQSREQFEYKCQLQELITRRLSGKLLDPSVTGPNSGRPVQFKIYLIGSSLTSIGSKRSDIDLCMVIYDRDTGRVDERFNQRFWAELLLERICTILEQEQVSFKSKVIRANVPILKFFDRQHVEVNLNLNKLVTVQNTMLLVHFCSLDSRVAPFLFTVKLWAQKNGINCAFFKSLSSYSLSLMAIFFLQNVCRPPILPAFAQVVDYVVKSTSLFHFSDKSVLEHSRALHQSANVDMHHMHVTTSAPMSPMMSAPSLLDSLQSSCIPPPPPPPPLSLLSLPHSTDLLDPSKVMKHVFATSAISKVTFLDSAQAHLPLPVPCPSHSAHHNNNNTSSPPLNPNWTKKAQKKFNQAQLKQQQQQQQELEQYYYWFYYYYYYNSMLSNPNSTSTTTVATANTLTPTRPPVLTSGGSSVECSSSTNSDCDRSSISSSTCGSTATSASLPSPPSWQTTSVAANNGKGVAKVWNSNRNAWTLSDGHHSDDSVAPVATTSTVVNPDTDGHCPTPLTNNADRFNTAANSVGAVNYNNKDDNCLLDPCVVVLPHLDGHHEDADLDDDDYDGDCERCSTTTTNNVAPPIVSPVANQHNGLINGGHCASQQKHHNHHHHQTDLLACDSDCSTSDTTTCDDNGTVCHHQQHQNGIDRSISVIKSGDSNPNLAFKSSNTQSLGSLFADFIAYYSDRSIFESVISIRTGQLMRRTDPVFARSSETSMETFICIEEPFNHTNTSHSVHNDFMFNFICKSFCWTRESISKMKLTVNDF